jgi:hypothetical protein
MTWTDLVQIIRGGNRLGWVRPGSAGLGQAGIEFRRVELGSVSNG